MANRLIGMNHTDRLVWCQYLRDERVLRRRGGKPLDATGFGSGWRGVLPAMLLTLVAGPAIGIALAEPSPAAVRPGCCSWARRSRA